MFFVLGFRGAWVSHAPPRVPKRQRQRQQPGASTTATTGHHPVQRLQHHRHQRLQGGPRHQARPTLPGPTHRPAMPTGTSTRSSKVPPPRHRQNITIHQGITYNALAIGISGGANTLSSAGGTLTNKVTSTTDTGNTTTPPPTHGIDTLDHNQCNTYNYRPEDSRRNYPNTRDNRHHQDRKPTDNQPTTRARRAPRQGWPARNRRPPKRRPRPAPTPTTPTPSDHHETHQPPSITCDTLTVGNTSDASTHGTIHTTTNPTNDVPRYVTYNTLTITTTALAQNNTYGAPPSASPRTPAKWRTNATSALHRAPSQG